MMKRALLVIVVLAIVQATFASVALQPKPTSLLETMAEADGDADNAGNNNDGKVSPEIDNNEPDPSQDDNAETIDPELIDEFPPSCEPNCPTKKVEGYVVPAVKEDPKPAPCTEGCNSATEYVLPEMKAQADKDGSVRIVDPNAIPDTQESDSNDANAANDQFETEEDEAGVDEASDDDDDAAVEDPQAKLDALEDAGEGELGNTDLTGKVTHTTTTVITETTGPAEHVKKTDPADIAAAAQKAVEAAQAQKEGGDAEEEEKMVPVDELNKAAEETALLSKISKLRKRTSKKL